MPDPLKIVTEARRLFNARHDWHVHEVLEELWKVRAGKEKELLQGLILVSAALVHASNGKMEVCWSMMERALMKLDGQPDDYYGWNISVFRSHFKRVLDKKTLRIPEV